MPAHKYIYSFRYDNTESMLCKLESKYLFKKEEKNKQLFTDVKIEPSRSAFLKTRLDVVSYSSDFSDLLEQIKELKIRTDGFKVEYLILEGDTTRNEERLSKLKGVGYSIDTFPDYHNPTITYAICTDQEVWYFGILNKNNFDWQKHKQKPHSYSNSIKQNIAKALVNIAVDSKQGMLLLDACCGAGTIMLEACFAGFTIEGCDISWKTCKNARANLAHFDYKAEVHHSDIDAINKQYDAAIIDLPYNLYSPASDLDLQHIITSTSKITNRLIIVSAKEIESELKKAGLKLLDHCFIKKRGKANFKREIWVCESEARNLTSDPLISDPLKSDI